MTTQAPAAPAEIVVYLQADGDGPPRAERRPPPALGPDELLVQVGHVVLGAPELAALAEGHARRVAPGGAAVGTVVATGSAAGDHLGRRVALGPHQPCGECDDCRRGRLATCPALRVLGRDTDGALASHVVVRRRWVCPLDERLAGAAPGPEAALLAREAVLAYALFTRAGAAAGDLTAWLGDGPVAALGRRVARAAGAIVAPAALPGAADASAWAAGMRQALGDATAILPPVALWRVLLTGEPVADDALGAATALLRLGAMLGVHAAAAPTARELVTTALAEAAEREAALFTLAVPHPDLVPEVAALAARGALPLADLVEPHPLADWSAALTAARRGDRAVILAI